MGDAALCHRPLAAPVLDFSAPLLTAHSRAALRPWAAPFHATTASFSRAFGRNDRWFASWIEYDALLLHRAAAGLPEILDYPLRAYDSALSRVELDFRVPELVRAAEGVIALPRGEGAGEFARRAIRIAPHLHTDEHVGSELSELLTVAPATE